MNKKKLEKESLRMQRELHELYKTHINSKSGPQDAFHVYFQMVWFGLNGLRSVWSELKAIGLPSNASWIDFMKPKVIGLMERAESVGHDKLRERRKKGETMPDWIAHDGGEHYTDPAEN